MALIKCTECGKMISTRALKCPDCGCPVVVEKSKMVCPECGEEFSEGDSKCANCGFPISMSIRKTKDVQASCVTDNFSAHKRIEEAQKQPNAESVVNTNNSRTVRCKHCGYDISPQASQCPYCGRISDWYARSYNQERNQKKPNENRAEKILKKALFVFLIVGVGMGVAPYVFDIVVVNLNKFKKVREDNDPSITSLFASESNNSTSSQDDNSSSSYSFRSPHDVIGYLSSHEFCKGSNCITFHNMCLYTNGTCATGAVKIISFNEYQAIVEAYSPYLGGNIRFKVDKNYGSLTDLNTGDIYD